MAKKQWTKQKVNPEDINNGNEYDIGDQLSLEALNAIVNNSFYGAEHGGSGGDYIAGNGLKLNEKEFSIDPDVVAQQTDLNKALFSSTTNDEVWLIPVKPTLNYNSWNTTTLTMNFRSGSENFKQFKILLDYSDNLGLIYDSTRVYTRTFTKDFWLNESYRTIILQEPASGNIKTWLENIGAVKQGEDGTPNKSTGNAGIIKQKTGDNFYPKTFIDAVYDDNGNPLNTLMPVANPTLGGTETNLTALSVNGTKYKIPVGGGSGGDYIAGNGINITDNTISADTNVLATKEDIPAGETDITFNGTPTTTSEDLNNVVIGDTTYLVPSNISYNPNLLLNDEMTINQRGKSVYYGENAYGTDRWMCVDESAFMRLNSSSQWAIGLEDTDSAGERIAIKQIIENYQSLKGQTVTLTLSYSNLTESVSGTTQLTLYDGVKTETVALTSSGTAILTATISSNADRVEVRIKTSATGTDTSLVFKYCKLELGGSSTPLVPKNIGLALTECQRYYQKLSTFGCSNIPTTATSFDAPINLFTPLRTTPILTLSAKPLIIGNGNSISSTSYSISSVKNNKAIINLQCTQSMTLNQVYVLSDVIAELDAEMY